MNNNRLSKLTRLESRVAVYVPGTNGVDAAADNSATVNAAAALLSDLFGGATAQSVRGFWMSDAAGLVAENTTIVYSYADGAALEAGMDRVIDFCENMRDALKQEAVSLEVNNTLYFI